MTAEFQAVVFCLTCSASDNKCTALWKSTFEFCCGDCTHPKTEGMQASLGYTVHHFSSDGRCHQCKLTVLEVPDMVCRP